MSENSWTKRDPVAQRKHASKISKNRPKSEEQRKKLSEIQKGKKLVNNGKVAIFVDHINVSELLSQGWKLGKL